MAVTWKKLAFEIDVVTKALFDAHSVLMAITDDTPQALSITEQTVVGRLTGGNIAAIALGISDNNVVQMDDADAAEHDYVKLTTAGLVGRSYAEVLGDLSAQAANAFDLNSQQLQNFANHNVADNAAKLALTPILGKIVFQADELAFYGCTVVV